MSFAKIRVICGMFSVIYLINSSRNTKNRYDKVEIENNGLITLFVIQSKSFGIKFHFYETFPSEVLNLFR